MYTCIKEFSSKFILKFKTRTNSKVCEAINPPLYKHGQN